MKIVIGLILATIGGGIQGAFVYPLKFLKNWKWENGWFIFTITCCLVFPTILAFPTTPDLVGVYRDMVTSSGAAAIIITGGTVHSDNFV
ncbi:MAG TPA: hypothetical protein ENI20_19885 [Bacteroides sp.]|nr:hypothetical protein [Bacteroides sp.]